MKSKGFLFTGVGLIILFLLTSCSNTRFIPDNDALYIGSKVNINDSTLAGKKKKELKEDLNKLTRPRPNTKILGLRIKLYAYNIAGKTIKRKGLKGWLKYKFGEPPVLLSQVNLDHNAQVLDNNLENQGYFQASASADTVVKRKRATAVYTVEPGPQYKIAGVKFDEDSSILQKKILETAGKTFLKPGDPFNLDMVKAERDRIDGYLKERGFYFFNPDYLIIQVDSTIGDNKVNLYVKVKPSAPASFREVYQINDIFVFSNYSLSTSQADTNTNNAVFYKGYYVVDEKKIYKPKLFQQVILFNPGDVYTRRKHNRTLNRLIHLNLFKFVKNRFEVVPGIDSAKLNTYYYLTPFPKKSIRAEVNTNTKSNNLTGYQLSVGFQNRNTFKAGELLSINALGGSEVQVSGRSRQLYNTFRAGAEATLTLPRFLIPFFNFNTRGGFVPQTNIQVGFDLLNKQELYTLKSFRGSYGYSWKENFRTEHEFNPISVTYVQPLNVTQEYRDSVAKNPILLNAIDTQFILGSNYSYLYNQLTGGNNDPFKGGLYFNGTLDVSGNVAGLIKKGNIQQGKPSEIFGVVFSQYVKAQTDFRYYLKTGKTNVLANRIIVGIGYPYGNSLSLPFIKQFYIGGNNSIRAFRSRSVGPGTYVDPNDSTSSFLPDQSGDLKLELNTELRAKLYSIFHGALFVDAGNIWLYNDNPQRPRPGGKFSKDFLKELAVGAGVGLRVDITFLVLRIDVAFPLRKPWLAEKDRWVIDQIKWTKDWRRENLVFNLAIGYPF